MSEPMDQDDFDLAEPCVQDEIIRLRGHLAAATEERDAAIRALDELLAETRMESPITRAIDTLANVMQRRYARERDQWKANHDQRKAERDKLRDELAACRASNASLRAYHDDNERLSTSLASLRADFEEVCGMTSNPRYFPMATLEACARIAELRARNAT